MNNITFTASPMTKPDDLSPKASLAWDYFKFNVGERNWFCVETMDGSIIVTTESRDLKNNGFVFSDYDSFLEWLEAGATDKLAEDPSEYFRACGVVPDILLSDAVVQALLATVNAAETTGAAPVSAEKKPEPPVADSAPEQKMQDYYVTFRIEGLYTICVEAPDPETAKATAQTFYDAEETDFNDMEYIGGEVDFVKDEQGNIVYEH